jgi:signal peptidase I
MLLFRVVVVAGPSMKNTRIHGDYIVLLNNVLYGEPKQGDIVVVSKEAFKNGEPIIKRVIATEGQWVDIKDGKVYVDNKPLDEKYTLSETEKKTAMEFPLQVEKGCVFVMGDNREVSMDSRYPEIGQVDCREILGKAIFLAFPGEDERTETRDLKRIGGIS